MVVFVLTAFIFSCHSQRGKIAMLPTLLKLGTFLVHWQSAQDDDHDEYSGARADSFCNAALPWLLPVP
jgi:hypothetical protein